LNYTVQYIARRYDEITMTDTETAAPVTIVLDPVEIHFLVTVLRSSGSVLDALTVVQRTLPGLSPPPLTTDAIVKMATLAEKIERQVPEQAENPI
jgi:hypothetical protein